MRKKGGDPSLSQQVLTTLPLSQQLKTTSRHSQPAFPLADVSHLTESGKHLVRKSVPDFRTHSAHTRSKTSNRSVPLKKQYRSVPSKIQYRSAPSKIQYQSVQLKTTSEFEYGKIDIYLNNREFSYIILSNLLSNLEEILREVNHRQQLENSKNNNPGQNGGENTQIQYNIYSDKEQSLTNMYLILDNFHDFAFKNDADKFFNFVEIQKKFTNTHILGSLHTFENKMFLRKLSDYRQSNPLNCIIGENIFKNYNSIKQIPIDGHVFVDTVPVALGHIYQQNQITRTIATIYDPSPCQQGTSENLDLQRQINFFNEAIIYLKNIYSDLKDVGIILQEINNNNFTFNISYKGETIAHTFEVGTSGIFSIDKIWNVVTQAEVPEVLEKLKKQFNNKDIFNSFMLMMKALGDFSQLYFAFKFKVVPNSTNLLTTVDKWLFTIALHCNMKKVFENEECFLLLGTGNTVDAKCEQLDTEKPKTQSDKDEENRKSTGSKILIYNNKDFFKNKTLKNILEKMYSHRSDISIKIYDEISQENFQLPMLPPKKRLKQIELIINKQNYVATYEDIVYLNQKATLPRDIDKMILKYTEIREIFDFIINTHSNTGDSMLKKDEDIRNQMNLIQENLLQAFSLKRKSTLTLVHDIKHIIDEIFDEIRFQITKLDNLVKKMEGLDIRDKNITDKILFEKNKYQDFQKEVEDLKNFFSGLDQQSQGRKRIQTSNNFKGGSQNTLISLDNLFKLFEVTKI